MRLLRLVEPDDYAVDFHPYVTILRGLGEERQRRVLEAAEAIPHGSTSGMTGLIEVHGVVLDLSSEMLDLLSLDGTDTSVVVRADDLPGGGRGPARQRLDQLDRELPAARERVAEAEAELERRRAAEAQARDDLEAARDVLDEAASAADEAGERGGLVARRDELERIRDEAAGRLESARSDLAAAEDALAEVVDATESVRDRRRDTAREGTSLAAELEQARSALDPGAEAGLEDARRHLDEVEAAAEVERGEARATGDLGPVESPEARLARLEVRRAELDGLVAALTGEEVGDVEIKLEAALGAADAEPTLVPSEEAGQLADELAGVVAELEDLDGDDVRGAEVVQEARQRLEHAREALAEAEAAVRMPNLDRDDVDQLEQAHADLLEAQERADARFAGKRHEKRVEDARAAENALLERLGFTTYADYMMGTSILSVDPVREAALESARTELSEAEDAWASLQSEVDGELRRVELHDRRRDLRDRALVLVDADDGVADDDLVAELRSLRVASPVTDDPVRELAAALNSVGFAVDDEDVELDELVALATGWLAEEDAASVRREQVLRERNEVDVELAETRSELSRAFVAVPETTPEERRSSRVAEAAAAVAAAEEHLRRHQEAAAQVAELEERLEVIRRSDGTAATEAEDPVGSAEADVASAREEVEDAEQEVAEAERELDDTRQALAAYDESLDAEIGPLRRAVEEADASLARARDDLAAAGAALETARRDVDALEQEHRDVSAEGASAGPGADAEEIEWYLMARLAAQRQVSYAGSVPLFIHDAFHLLDDDAIRSLLDRLERMAAAVQLVVLSDEEPILDWALAVGDERVAVVEAVAADQVQPFD